jgi:peptide/nickel transport system substrate-binding protein
MQEIMEETGGYVWICHQKRAVAHRDYFEPKIAPSGVESYRRFREA